MLASRSLRSNLVLAQDSGDAIRRRYPISLLLPYEAGRVHSEEPHGEVAPAILNGALGERRRLSASPPATQESSTSSLELPLVVVAPVARVYPVIIVPIRMRGTETGSVQPADRRVRVKQEAVLLVLQVLRLEKYPDVSLIVDGAEAGRSGPPEIPPDQGAARNFDVSPEGMDEVCEVSLICPRPAVVVWVAEIGIVRHFLAVEAADVVRQPLRVQNTPL